MTAEPSRRLVDVLTLSAEYLAGRGVENPRLAAELLAGRLLQCKRLQLYLMHDKVLDEPRLAAMRRGVKRVGDGEPIQYVLGETDFLDHTFKVDRRALIPRPETEELVNLVLQYEPLWARERPRIVDAGTGSGCIVISLALARPEALYMGVDVSEDAVALARENATRLGAQDRVAFVAGELSDAVAPGTLDALVANLPYIATSDWEKLPVHIRDHEPRLALDGGPQGLTVIEATVQDASFALKPGGFVFLEIGADQANPVRELMAEAGFEDIAVVKDLARRDRIVRGTLSHTG